MRHIVITGASSGLGLAIKNELDTWQPFNGGFKVHDWSLATGVDVTKQEDIDKAICQLPTDSIYALINCAGINVIDWFDKITEEDFDQVMDVNAKALWRVSKSLIPQLRKDCGTILNIVSNASHMPMTHSIAYNASKGAAHIMTLQMARELFKTHSITVFGISPNKLSGTGMSAYIEDRVPKLRGWTKEEAEQYQKAALPTGAETEPELLAEFISFLLSTKDRHRYLHGCILPYGA